MPDSVGEWREYQRLVLDALQRHATSIGLVDAKVNAFDVRLSVISTKVALWGMVASGVTSALVAFVMSKVFGT